LETKICTGCEKEKSITEFGKNNSSKSGLRSRCKKCESEYGLKRYHSNPKKFNEQKRIYRLNNLEHCKQLERKSSRKNSTKRLGKNRFYKLKAYGLTPQDYDFMLAAQSFKCEICPTKHESEENKFQKLSVDHCHKTGKVRALLCTLCNGAVGFVRESLETVENLKNYLIKHK